VSYVIFGTDAPALPKKMPECRIELERLRRQALRIKSESAA
jgi:hypothetical protein